MTVLTPAYPGLAYPEATYPGELLGSSDALQEGQFGLRAARWGAGTPLVVEDGDMPMPDLRDEDTERALGHGAIVGRDRLSTSTWTWDLATDADDFEDGAEHALALFDALGATWRSGLNLAPNQVLALRYRALGRTRRVYGRPRRFQGPKPNLLTQMGQGRGAISFQVTEPYTFDDATTSVTINRIAPVSTGLTLPASLPAVLGTRPTEDSAAINVQGEAPTPFVAQITGPVFDPWISGPGWLIALQGSIGPGDVVRIDTLTRTIRRGVTDVRGKLKKRSTLSGRLPVGTSWVNYGGTDPTNLSSVTLTWRPAHYSI